MNLVIDDFYHAHAHSLRPLCIEGCGDLVANSYVGDCALTRTRNTEKKRTGNVTSTAIGNVTESISGGAVEIKNELDGKTVTEKVTGDYKAEITAMNYETTFVVNGERKEMDMSPKFDAWWMGSLSANYVNPRMAMDYGAMSETFIGAKNSNFLGASLETRMSVKVEAVDKGPVIGKKAQEIVNINISCVSYSSTIIKSKICINNSNLIMNG